VIGKIGENRLGDLGRFVGLNVGSREVRGNVSNWIRSLAEIISFDFPPTVVHPFSNLDDALGDFDFNSAALDPPYLLLPRRGRDLPLAHSPSFPQHRPYLPP
jgi:hypothetical protein